MAGKLVVRGCSHGVRSLGSHLGYWNKARVQARVQARGEHNKSREL